MVEFREFREEFEGQVALGNEIKVADVFKEGDFVDAIGTSKGKGFQGVVKRHGFSGVGQATHGQHNRMRAPVQSVVHLILHVFSREREWRAVWGTIVKVINLRVMKVVAEQNLIVVSGSIPGAKNSTVLLEK